MRLKTRKQCDRRSRHKPHLSTCTMTIPGKGTVSGKVDTTVDLAVVAYRFRCRTSRGARQAAYCARLTIGNSSARAVRRCIVEQRENEFAIVGAISPEIGKDIANAPESCEYVGCSIRGEGVLSYRCTDSQTHTSLGVNPQSRDYSKRKGQSGNREHRLDGLVPTSEVDHRPQLPGGEEGPRFDRYDARASIRR